MFSNRRKWIKRICLLILGLALVWLPKCSVEASGGTKIHFISLYSTTDAILLESNGHYGMIDSGEDWDYPSEENYPFLDGVTKGIGYEQQVIHYLREQGVEKLDFYIATHAHSDHIGSGDEILKAFPVDRLYINEYSDSYISDEKFFWDNQYVYDCLIQTAQERGVQIVTDLDLQENESSRSFSMENMQIEIMNYERERDEFGQYLPVPNENCNSLVIKVTAFDKVALLTGDIDPWVSDTAEYGDTAKVANQLIDQLWTEEEQSGSEVQINENYDITNYENYKGVTLSVPGEESGNTGLIDETKPNTEKTISLDLLKLSHHAMDYNNTTYFLTSLNPKTVVVTGFESFYNAREKDCMPNARMFATATDSAAVVAEFREDGIQTEYVKMSPGWMEYEGESYYFDENGRTYTDGKSHIVDGKEYGFNEKGAIMSSDGWIREEGAWRYWYAQEERFAYNEWIEVGDFKYYCDDKGEMLTGWKRIDDSCYYFNDRGELERDVWIDGHYLDQDGKWVKEYSTASWRKSGNRWWYRYGNGGYASDGWTTIDHKKYYFDSSGWMAVGWKEIDGIWYYFKKNGHLAVNTWIGDCYVDGTGAWDKEYTEDLWIKSGGRWWYRHGDGSYTKSDFEDINGERYYFDENGWMVTGWKKIEEDWYYFKGGGALAADVWVGSCYVDHTGRWIQSEKPSCWMKSGGRWWYRHGDGSYTKEAFEKIENIWYYFDAGGWMATGWRKIGEDWYYFGTSGAMKTEGWVGEYYLKANGKMAVDEWVANGKYYVDEKGICQYIAEALQSGKSVDNR